MVGGAASRWSPVALVGRSSFGEVLLCLSDENLVKRTNKRVEADCVWAQLSESAAAAEKSVNQGFSRV